MLKFIPEIWPGTKSVTFVPSPSAPNLPVTAVKIYVFERNKLLLAKVSGRGWDLPGGHVESGESPDEALIRELKEETGAVVSRQWLIGYLEIINDGSNPKYPDHSCILVYKGQGLSFDQSHVFPSHEVTHCKLIAINELPRLHHNWNDSKKQVIDYAFDA
jgi:8-oxo-dGTP pyrophosphatase MutT (NUDIX family)